MDEFEYNTTFDEDDWVNTNVENERPSSRILWQCLIIFTTIVSTVGNVMVIWTILKRKILKTATYYLVASIALSDLVFVILHVIPHTFHSTSFNLSSFNIFCKMEEFLIRCCMLFTPITLMAISRVQYYSILCPYQNQIKTKNALQTIFGILVCSFVISVPGSIYATAVLNENEIYCHLNWPNGHWLIRKEAYDMLFAALCYILPAPGLLVINGYIMKRMERNAVDVVNKRQMIKTLLVVSKVFVVGLFPFWYFIVLDIFDNDTTMPYNILILVLWMSYLSAATKPIIYVTMNQKFRCQFYKTFPKIPFLKDDSANGEGSGINLN